MRPLSITAALLAAFSVAGAQDQQTPVKPPPVPGGVIPLPNTPPPTDPQGPAPKAIRPLPPGKSPMAWSPDVAGVTSFLAQRPITMQEAVSIALYTNRTFATAVASLEQAAGRKNQATAGLNPTLGVNGQLTEFDAPTTFNIASLSGAGGSSGSASSGPPFVILPQFNPIFTAAFTLPIDVFGALRSAANQAQLNEVASRIDVNRVRNEIVYAVKTAFYNVLRAQAQVAVATDNLNNSLARLNDADKNYGAGTNSRFDVLTAQRDVADAQQALITARAQVVVNLGVLKNTMGIDIKSRMSVDDKGSVSYPPAVAPPPQTPPPAAPLETPASPPTVSSLPTPVPNVDRGEAAPKDAGGQLVPLTPPSVDQVKDDYDWGPQFQSLLTEAMATRPEIAEGQAMVRAGKAGLQYARSSELPTFTFTAQDVLTPDATGFTRHNQGVFTLGINVPIYDGGMARARVQEQEGNIAQAEVSLRQAADQVTLDVQQAYLALVQAQQKVAVTNVELAQAQESFRVSRVRYRAGVSAQAGVSPQLELSNAQTSLAQAQQNQVNALYDYNSARAQLDHALGRYAYNGEEPGYKSKPTSQK